MEFKNHNIIKEHHTDCIRHPDSKYGIGATTTHNVMVFINCDFYFITFCGCIKGYQAENEFIADIIRQNLKKSKKIDCYKVERSYVCDSELRKTIREGNLMSEVIHELNYVYYDNAGKQYAICSKRKLINAVIRDNDLIDLNYEKALKYIQENDFNYFKHDLDVLYKYNKMPIYGGVSYKTIEEFNKYLRKTIREKKKNYETSKH